MRLTTVIISLIITFYGLKSSAQEIPKDTIYLEFEKNNGSLPYYRGKKFNTKNGINFNLHEGNGLFFPNGGEIDTISIINLKKYPITRVESLDSLGKNWYRKNLKALKVKYGRIIAPHDNNGKFVTYIIEKFRDYFILYRVFWRNQGVIER